MNSPLAPAGPHAQHIAELTWFLVAVCGVAFVLLLAAFAWSLLRRRTPDLVGARDAARRLPIAIAVGAVVLVLCVFVGASYATDRKLLSYERDAALEIVITGHQWWWEIRYLDQAAPSRELVTANELHLPQGKRAHVTLKSSDVIHSFWIPVANGKRDIIPGRDNAIWLQFDQTGIWKGRCAEFCGLEHAKMELVTVVQSPDEFEAWKNAQLQPAVATPADAAAQRGQKLFVQGPCAMCHQIRGVEGLGPSSVAPDLTHLKSRQYVGAGAALNVKGNLGGWIVDAHGIKPGVRMPTILLNGDELQDLLAYLETLQ